MGAAILVAGLAAEVYLLAHDLPGPRAPATRAPNGAAPVAELMSKHNTVRVQDEGELVWEETRAGDTLYRRQSVLTLESSKAEVAFLDGTGLVIGERSLVVLEKAPADDSAGYRRIVVKLMRGTIHKGAPRKGSSLLARLGDKTPDIEIQAGDARIELSPASELSVELPQGSSAGPRLIVQSGEVRVESPQGSLSVKQGEEARLPARGAPAAEGAPVARKLPFALLSPKAGQALAPINGELKARFRWNASPEAVAGSLQELEVSQDPSFEKGVIRSKVAAASPPLEHVELNVSLPAAAAERPAQWHWRVRAVGAGSPSAVSPVESFWVRPAPTPAPKLPADRASRALSKPVEFAWSAVDGANGYELEIGGAPSVSATEPFARVEGLAAGPHAWRVRARMADGGVSPWSTARELAIVDGAAPEAELPPPPDDLEEPEITPAPAHTSTRDGGWIRRALDLVIARAEAAEDAGSWSVRLKWKAVKGVGRYKIQVARDRSFKTIIGEGESAGPEWNWSYRRGMENTKGRAFFRVASVSASGKTGAFSKAKPITIPKAILGEAAAPSSSEPETYSALESPADAVAGEAPVSADAAEHGDLDALAPKKAEPVAAATPPATAPAAAAAVPFGPRPKPSEPPAAAAPAPAAVAASLPSAPGSIEWNFSLAAGIGSLSQTSGEANLASVATDSPFLQQRVGLRASHPGWTSGIEASFASFSAPDSARKPLQPDFSAVSARADLLLSSGIGDQWHAYWGGALDRSYRWVKSGLQSVEASGALSLGPAARVSRGFAGGGALAIREAGIALSLPLSGALTGSQAGLQGRAWADWDLARLGAASSLGIRAEGETAYLHWSQPSGTTTFEWKLWIAPTLRF